VSSKDQRVDVVAAILITGKGSSWVTTGELAPYPG
ncbi:hypothetical protein MAAFP003_2635, partial [Mycobacterium ahvazicum]